MGSCFLSCLVLSCLPIDDAPVQLAMPDGDEGLRAVGRGGRFAGAGRETGVLTWCLQDTLGLGNGGGGWLREPDERL